MQDFLNHTLRNVRHMKYLQEFVQVTLLVCDRGIENNKWLEGFNNVSHFGLSYVF